MTRASPCTLTIQTAAQSPSSDGGSHQPPAGLPCYQGRWVPDGDGNDDLRHAQPAGVTPDSRAERYLTQPFSVAISG
jgi:hypothetical protein